MVVEGNRSQQHLFAPHEKAGNASLATVPTVCSKWRSRETHTVLTSSKKTTRQRARGLGGELVGLCTLRWGSSAVARHAFVEHVEAVRFSTVHAQSKDGLDSAILRSLSKLFGGHWLQDPVDLCDHLLVAEEPPEEKTVFQLSLILLALRQQLLQTPHATPLRSLLDRTHVVAIHEIRVCAGIDEELHCLRVTLRRSHHQGGLPSLVSCVHICLSVKKNLAQPRDDRGKPQG